MVLKSNMRQIDIQIQCTMKYSVIGLKLTILLLSADSSWVVISYKRMYVHEALVKHFVKLARKISVVR